MKEITLGGVAVKDAAIKWNNEYANAVELKVYLEEGKDKLPRREEGLTFIKKETDGGTAYFAEDDGLVDFMHKSDGDSEGFGGYVFKLKTSEGIEEVKGPWSSRPGAMNALGLPLSVGADIMAPQGITHSYTGYGAITFEKFEQIVKAFFPDLEYGWIEKYGTDKVIEIVKDQPLNKGRRN